MAETLRHNTSRLARTHRRAAAFGLAIAAIAAILSLSAGISFWLHAPLYRAQAQVFVSTASDGSGGPFTRDGSVVQQRMKYCADIVASPPVLQPVIDKLGLPYDAETLAQNVAADNLLDTVLLDIQVTDTLPDRARDIANAIALRLPEVVDDLGTPAGEARSPIKVSLTKAAVTPEAPIKPRQPLIILLDRLTRF